MGSVITESVWEIIAIDAPVLVSPPYADGNTTVFNPSGAANAIRESDITISFAPMHFRMSIISEGITKSLKKAAMYT